MYSKEMKSGPWRDVCTPVFIEASFKIARDPKCLTIDEQWKKMWCMCICIYTHRKILFTHEKEENPAICGNTNETWGHYAKWN